MASELERRALSGVGVAEAVDVGLRRYMLRVYNYMALGLALTGGVALAVVSSPALWTLFFSATGLTALGWIAMIAPLGLVIALSFGIQRMSATTVQTLFWIYAALNGVGFSILFMAFTAESIARVFFITAGMFAAMSLWGYTTKRDLTGFGSFLFMGLIGLIIASVVNLFLGSTGMQFVISVIGVLIFTGLTAYDTQTIKQMYVAQDDGTVATRKAVFGALQLYLDFILLFKYLLYLLGNRE